MSKGESGKDIQYTHTSYSMNRIEQKYVYANKMACVAAAALSFIDKHEKRLPLECRLCFDYDVYSDGSQPYI